MTPRRSFLVCTILLLAQSIAADTIPAYFRLPPAASIDRDALVAEDYSEAAIVMSTDRDPEVFRGRRVSGALQLAVADDSSGRTLIDPIKASLTAAGWTIALESPDSNPAYATFRYQKDGKTTIAGFALYSRDDIRFDLVEIGGPKLGFTLQPPSATVEKVGPEGHFPYLTPLPDFSLQSTDASGAFLVTLPGQNEPTVIAAGSIAKFYERPSAISTLQFATLYRDALTKAGWQILDLSQGVRQTDAAILAHYTKNARDIWAQLHLGDTLTIRVADVGAENWARKLETDCRLPLYGLHFDFNKATMRPDSEPVLRKALAVLTAAPSMSVEVQGHTDNVGGDAYNQTLSQSRAESVKAWFAANGVAAARLTAKGYGRTQPVASNETDEGRAANRRVELRRQGCAK